jgi:uncharacterized protein YjbI with pentapeptide repeats
VANKEHIRRLKRGVPAWNAWREKRQVQVDLTDVDLSEVDLSNADLSGANLAGAYLVGAHLSGASLIHADLQSVDLNGADLSDADLNTAHMLEARLNGATLRDANLSFADLTDVRLNGTDLNRADLSFANLRFAKMSNANLSEARLIETVFADIDLTDVVGLETCVHDGPSAIDYRTLERSGPLPLAFLRGIGLPDKLIDYLPSLINQPIHYYSCFISYSTKDQDFADRIHADLQNKGVRCWFAPHDMPIGGKIQDEIDAAIRLRDKLVLILSEHSIKSDWVEDEVTRAFEEERKRGRMVLFPIRLDDAVMETDEAWAAKLRARHIGDFRRWKEHDAYKKSFARVVRDLTVTPAGSLSPEGRGSG